MAVSRGRLTYCFLSPTQSHAPVYCPAVSAPAEFDAYSDRYEHLIDEPLKLVLGGEESDYYVRLKAEELLAHLKRMGMTPSSSRVLDVGSGTGRMAELLAPRVAQIRGVEPSAGMVERANDRGLPPETFVQGEGTQLPFDSASFDVVFASCIFHHIDLADHLSVAREMRRVLKPGGVSFVFEHNPWNPLTQWVVSRCPVDVGVTLHSSRRMKKLWRRAGLAQVHSRFIVFVPGVLAALRPLEPRLWRVPAGGQYYVAGRS